LIYLRYKVKICTIVVYEIYNKGDFRAKFRYLIYVRAGILYISDRSCSLGTAEKQVFNMDLSCTLQDVQKKGKVIPLQARFGPEGG